MRNGNKEDMQKFVTEMTLFILPMRNGNKMFVFENQMSDFPFYPTYEEWKHKRRIDRKIEIFCLFILPMRNGNLLLCESVSLIYRLFILPMRNGNMYHPTTHCLALNLFILPMRNGNSKISLRVNPNPCFLSYWC